MKVELSNDRSQGCSLMCGIAGLLACTSEAVVDHDQLIAMRDTMAHRGPDGAGIWMSADRRVGLAHRRLSIVDLSSRAAQPMSNEDGTTWITFNGEIYNHLPLRRLLVSAGHAFKTDHSDTEVLIHGFEEWGIEGLLQRLDGDFAFALWNGVAGELYLARDRVGVKPLYFSFANGLLLFASEIKAILAHCSVPRDIEPLAMYHFLSFLTTPAPMTMFKGVYKLPAAHYTCVTQTGAVRAVRYWDAAPGRGIPSADVEGLDDKAREEFFVDGIRSRLSEAVEKRMMSDVPFGVFLSGGIDSSAIVALMSKLSARPVETFTVEFENHPRLNETAYARRVSEVFRTNHHEISLNEGDMVGYLVDLAYSVDEPIADWVCIPLFFVSKLAKESGVTVVQIGEGADELFAGYDAMVRFLSVHERLWTPFRRWLPRAAYPAAAGIADVIGRAVPDLSAKMDMVRRAVTGGEIYWSGATVFWENMKRRLVNVGTLPPITGGPGLSEMGLQESCFRVADTSDVVSSWRQRLDRTCPTADILTRMSYFEFQLRLPELLLMRVDKITMSNSQEARVPYLDHRLVEFSMDIPQRDKVPGLAQKYLLKKAVEGLIPREIIDRKKIGFSAPMPEWLRGEFGLQAESTVLSSNLMKRGYFHTGFIQHLFRRHRSGQEDLSVHLWALYSLAAWYDRWIDSR